jgi:hypothetical protein
MCWEEMWNVSGLILKSSFFAQIRLVTIRVSEPSFLANTKPELIGLTR